MSTPSALGTPDPARAAAFARWAWGVLVYNLFVIVWGAFVRASGSGAGCGAHWPTCNGDIVPRADSIETAVELTHRLTSGLALVAVVVSWAWARRVFPPGHAARRAAGAGLAFMLVEAAVGAALVLLSLTGDDASAARAVVIALHLVNTFLLLAALTLTGAWAVTEPPKLALRGGTAASVLFGAVLLAVVGAAGAVTALGDTLFPAGSLSAGLEADLAPTAHFLVRLRVVHPAVAMAAFVYVAALAGVLSGLQRAPALRGHARGLVAVLVAQVAGGFLDLALLAPTWMQLVHLFFADVVWVAYVLFALEALEAQREPRGAGVLTAAPPSLAP